MTIPGLRFPDIIKFCGLVPEMIEVVEVTVIIIVIRCLLNTNSVVVDLTAVVTLMTAVYILFFSMPFLISTSTFWGPSPL